MLLVVAYVAFYFFRTIYSSASCRVAPTYVFHLAFHDAREQRSFSAARILPVKELRHIRITLQFFGSPVPACKPLSCIVMIPVVIHDPSFSIRSSKAWVWGNGVRMVNSARSGQFQQKIDQAPHIVLRLVVQAQEDGASTPIP